MPATRPSSPRPSSRSLCGSTMPKSSSLTRRRIAAGPSFLPLALPASPMPAIDPSRYHGNEEEEAESVAEGIGIACSAGENEHPYGGREDQPEKQCEEDRRERRSHPRRTCRTARLVHGPMLGPSGMARATGHPLLLLAAVCHRWGCQFGALSRHQDGHEKVPPFTRKLS